MVTGTAVDATYCGVVLSSGKTVDDSDGAAVYTQVEVACSDGTVRTFSVKGSTTYTEGRLVSVSVSLASWKRSSSRSPRTNAFMARMAVMFS